jgi:GNAT superfamily N-acetyltransferase
LSEITVRLATVADGNTLVTLISGLLTYESLPTPTKEAAARIKADLAAGKRFTAWIAEVEGATAGYALVFEAYSTLAGLPRLYLEDIFVLPEFRGHKVGLALMRAVVAEAERRGIPVVEWEALDWNRLAIDFYERLGAEHQTEWLNYRMDRAAMRKLLETTD